VKLSCLRFVVQTVAHRQSLQMRRILCTPLHCLGQQQRTLAQLAIPSASVVSSSASHLDGKTNHNVYMVLQYLVLLQILFLILVRTFRSKTQILNHSRFNVSTFRYIFTTFTYLLEPSCVVEEALVSGNIPIPDAQITASSEYDADGAPSRSRINNSVYRGGWVSSFKEFSAPEPRMYIQVC